MLQANWWIELRDDERVKAALVRAHLEHWVPRVDDLIEGHPHLTTHDAVAHALGLNPRNFRRWKSGQHRNLTTLKILALAGVLGADFHDLFPSTLDWVTRATQLILGDAVGLDDCRLCVLYCFQLRPTAPLEVNPTAMRQLVSRADCQIAELELGRIVTGIAGKLDRILGRNGG